MRGHIALWSLKGKRTGRYGFTIIMMKNTNMIVLDIETHLTQMLGKVGDDINKPQSKPLENLRGRTRCQVHQIRQQ